MLRKLIVYPVLSEDINSGAAWLPGSMQMQRLVKVTNKATSRTIYCEAMQTGATFEDRYNKQAQTPIADAQNFILLNYWYRRKLGVDRYMEADLEVNSTSGWWASFMSCIQHPQIGVRLATWLGAWSFVLGVIGVVLGVIGVVLGIIGLK